MKEKIIKNVKDFKGLKEDKSLDDLMEFYFYLGENQIKKYLGSDYLTETLYLLIQEFIIIKIQENFLYGEDEEIFLLDELDIYFQIHINMLNRYKKLVNL